MAKNQKYYVVWQGRRPGVYDTWEDCLAQVNGFAGARYKSFKTREEAEEAFERPSEEFVATTAGAGGRKASDCNPGTAVGIDSLGMTVVGGPEVQSLADRPVIDSIAVDAACSGNPGVMEYQGVYVASRTRLFHYKYPFGTNNIGEFLALVHGLAYLKKHKLDQIIYSDSVNAISWVRQKKCRSKLPRNERSEALWQMVERAEKWLAENSYSTEIRKWDTARWGEIPADFGRKSSSRPV